MAGINFIENEQYLPKLKFRNKNMFKTESIEFGNFLLINYVVEDNGSDCNIIWVNWKTGKKNTTEEIYNEWIKTYINPNIHPAT